MKRETYVKRLITSYKNLSNEEKKMFCNETGLTAKNSVGNIPMGPKIIPGLKETKADVEDRA